MKAWKVRNITDDDVGQEIIWADNVKEAKKKAHCTDLFLDYNDWINIRVNRAKEFDDMEKLSRKDFMKEQWKEGWWFWRYESELPSYDELENDEVDKVWDEWWEANFGRGY